MIYLCTDKSLYDWEFMKGEGIKYMSSYEIKSILRFEKELGLDIETTITNGPDELVDRKITLIQFGTKSSLGIDRNDQYIFDIPRNTIEDIDIVKEILEDYNKTFVIHYATFEYPNIQINWGIKIENIEDTFLLSKILNSGLEVADGYHSLAGCLERFFNIEIDKELQKSFDGNLLTVDQIKYGAIDVLVSIELKDALTKLVQEKDLYRVYQLEKEVVKCYGDMMCNPMKMDVEYWKDLAQELHLEALSYEKELNNFILTDQKLLQYVSALKLVQEDDAIEINWRSTTDVKKVLEIICPDKPDIVTKKPDIVKWAKTVNNSELDLYIDRDFNSLTNILISKYKSELISNGLFIEKGSNFINWASPQQKLAIFRFYYPDLIKTDDKSVAKLRHPLILKYKQFGKANKKVTSYGLKFLENNVGKGDLIRPSRLDQLLATGRISMGAMLTLPADNRYRNAFLPALEDYVFVDTDYSSVEIVIAAYASGEKAFIEAIENGWDLHSYSASLIYKDRWYDVAEPDCQFNIDKTQCKCEAHQKLRKFSKTITFGIFYGAGSQKVSDSLSITLPEAKQLISDYYFTFPNIKIFFEDSSSEGMKNNFIVGLAPYNRIRFFNYPEDEKDRAAIGRQSKNFKIQELSADITKLALIKIRKEINICKYRAFIQLAIHDEILTAVHKDEAENFKVIQDKLMVEAALEIMPYAKFSVSSTISDKWQK